MIKIYGVRGRGGENFLAGDEMSFVILIGGGVSMLML